MVSPGGVFFVGVGSGGDVGSGGEVGCDGGCVACGGGGEVGGGWVGEASTT